MGVGCLIVAWGAVSPFIAASPKGVIVDQIRAVVDKEIITDSELVIETRVSLVARGRQRGYEVADGPLDEKLLALTLEYLIGQVLIDNHVRRLGTVEVSEFEVERALEQFIRYFPTDDAYQAFKRKHDIPEATIREILRRDLRNDRYLQQRQRIWLGDRDEDPKRTERAKRALKRWLADLRKGAEVRLLGPTGELELGSDPDN